MTERQTEVLALIAARQRRAGPNIREVAELLGINYSAVQGHVSRLRDKGALEPETGNGLVVRERAPDDPKGVQANGVQATTKSAPSARPTTREPIRKPGGGW